MKADEQMKKLNEALTALVRVASADISGLHAGERLFRFQKNSGFTVPHGPRLVNSGKARFLGPSKNSMTLNPYVSANTFVVYAKADQAEIAKLAEMLRSVSAQTDILPLRTSRLLM
jgi:hypothetical protein